MINNPVIELMNAMRSGRNPMDLMQRMAMGDPRAAQALNIIRGKTPNELKNIAQNMAREQNIDLAELQQMFGMIR